MEILNSESWSVYHVEVSKTARPYLLLVPVNTLENLGCIRDFSLLHSAGFQDNLEGIHSISRLMYEIWQKMSGGVLEPVLIIGVT